MKLYYYFIKIFFLIYGLVSICNSNSANMYLASTIVQPASRQVSRTSLTYGIIIHIQLIHTGFATDQIVLNLQNNDSYS